MDKEQQGVLLPTDIADVPRLDRVSGFNLHVMRTSKGASTNQKEETEDADEAGERELPPPVPDSREINATNVLAELNLVKKSIAKLRLPMWLLVLVSFAALIFHK